MNEKKRVLVTGHLGFIGQIAVRNLRAAGYDVLGMDISSDNTCNSVAVNLLDPAQIAKAMSAMPDFQVLIHMAALAHNQKPPAGYSLYDANIKMTENIVSSVENRKPHIIFLSSVAVYGEDGRPRIVCVDSAPRPATAYGQSKLESERIILASGSNNCDILRAAPVYDEQHLEDVAKRVYFPAMRGVKMRLFPPPYYSLCHVNRLVGKILECVSKGGSNRQIMNVADPVPYSQHQLLEWFDGITIPFPVICASPLYLLAKMIPGSKGYAFRCLFSKLFVSNIYDV